MSYVLIEDVPASWERYEPIARSLGTRPPGLLLHVAGPTDEGFRIVEVWESEADWLAFADAMGLALAGADAGGRTQAIVRTVSTAHDVIGLGAAGDRTPDSGAG